MASSSKSYQQNDGFSVIEPVGARRKVSESSRLFDVFINHRGPDVKQTLALKLHNSLQDLGIKAFLDCEETEFGDSFPSTIETAIRSASVHIAIFSKRYAESAWCLNELVLMLQTSAKIIPVFYDVQPSELRYIEKGEYAHAFTDYKEKSRHMEKLEKWKEALQTVSFYRGWEFYNSDVFEDIVSAVEKEVKRTKSLYVAKYLVGLDNLVQDFERRTIHDLVQDFERRTIHDLVQDFERECMLNNVAEQKARAVGIFGMGGLGKTTLSKELFNRMRAKYTKTCFLFDVREASAKGQLPSLQVQLIKDLFNKQDSQNFRSIEEGTCYIKNHLERSSKLSFLLIVDDIDHVNQLDALLFNDILNKSRDSLLIVTTRDVGVLISTGINTGYKMKGMNINDARELFCWHAFEQPRPAIGYEGVVDDFIDVCGGLPLSLQVLGSHVRGRDLTYWSLELDKVCKILPSDIKESLKISFDALEPEEKQIFMDIACFFINVDEKIAITIWKGCGWNAQHALRSLKDKCLINIDKVRLGMHDHLRDLGRAMTEEMSGPRRLWRPQELESLELKGFQTILAQTNVRCFQRILDRSLKLSIKYFIGNSKDRSETSASLLWLEIGFTGACNQMTSIPSWINLKNLRCLQIETLHFKRLWQSEEQGPSSLKEFPGICDLTNLVQLKIHGCPQLEELPCLFHLSSLESVSICDCLKLNGLQLDGCNKLRRVNVFDVPKLAIFNIRHCPQMEELRIHRCPQLEKLPCLFHLSCLESVSIGVCLKLNGLQLDGCNNLRRVNVFDVPKFAIFNIRHCPQLKELSIHECPQLEELPCLFHLSSLESVSIVDCLTLNGLQLDGYNNLRRVYMFAVPKLAIFNIRHCPQLEELIDFVGQHSLERITIDGCGKLNELKLSDCVNLKTLSGNVNVAKLKIINCPKLEALSSLADVEELTIDGCKNAAIRNSIHMFQRVPSKSLFVSGRAVDGAESIFSEDHFSDCIGMKAHVIPIGSYVQSAWASAWESAWESPWESASAWALASASAWASASTSTSTSTSAKPLGLAWASPWACALMAAFASAWESAWASAWESTWASISELERGSLSAIIICGLASISELIDDYEGLRLHVVQNEVITIVITGQELIDDYERLGRLYMRHAMKKVYRTNAMEKFYRLTAIEKAYMVMVKKGEEWRTLTVMKIITDQLFKE